MLQDFKVTSLFHILTNKLLNQGQHSNTCVQKKNNVKPQLQYYNHLVKHRLNNLFFKRRVGVFFCFWQKIVGQK